MRLLYGDGWLDWTIRILGVLAISALLYLGYTIWQGERQARETSISARAIDNLEEAVKADPNNVQARVLLGDALRDTRSYSKAIEQYQAALDIDPESSGALAGLGIVAMAQGEWQTASGYWESAIDILREVPMAEADLRLERAYYYYGLTLIELVEYEEAVGYFKEALRIKKSDAGTHYALSVAYGRLESFGKQKEELEAALAFVPSMPEANYDLGLLVLAEGDEARAAELFRTSADNAPGRAEPRTELEKLGTFEERFAAAQAAFSADKERALAEARVALALAPTSVDAARMVATLHQELSSTEVALQAWNKVLQLVPNDPEAEAAVADLTAQ